MKSSEQYKRILQGETHSIEVLLQELTKRLSWDKTRIVSEQGQALRKLLRYAKQHSPYYQTHLSTIDPEDFSLADLCQLPVMTKKEVMENWNEIVTDRDLTLEKASEFLMYQTEPGLLDNRYHLTATGGSSGIRGLFPWSVEEFILFTTIFFRFQYRDEFSHRTDDSPPLLVAAITAEKPIHLSRFVFTMPVIPQMKVMLLPATTPLAKMVEALNQSQPTHLIGYTTEIYQLAKEACQQRLKINPQRVSVNSEPLFPDMLATIKKAWNVPVTNMWGSSDVGPHAQSCDYSDHLHINEDFIIIEAVDENYQAVPEGQEAAKVLVTNLFHQSMPLFRYELDDRIIILDEPCPCGSSFRLVQSIQGRSDESFAYANNKIVIPEVFENIIFPEPGISEYQVIQTTSGAIVNLVATDLALDITSLHRKLIDAYHQLGFKRPQIKVKIVKQLNRHPETGKLKRFIRLVS
jgi:phenylacetate-coenzyme A ligase PaaK-like adenylate-forming protein